MNWTGGRLSRHSRNANGSLPHRQHVAKARINLLNAPQKRSPITWSIFDKVEGAASGDSLKLYTTLCPDRHNEQEFIQKDQRRSQKRRRSKTSLKSTLPKVILQGNKKSCLGWEPNEGSPTNGGSHHGVYQETRSPSDTEIDEQQSPPVETADDMNVVYEADSLKERRRKILRRIDWVGTNIQHPIKLRFTIAEDDERLGKRRRITARHQSHFRAVVQPMILSPFAKQRQKQRIHRSLSVQNVNGNSTKALPKTHVRISIGGRHVAAGASSESHSKTVGGRLVPSQASTCDVMLLDGDDMSRQQRQQLQERREHRSYPASSLLAPSSSVGNRSTFSASPKNLPIHTCHHKNALTTHNGSTATIHRHAAAIFDLERRIPVVWTGLNNSAVDIAPHLEERINNLREPSDQPIAFVTKSNPNLVTLRERGIENDPGFTNLKYADANQTQHRIRDSDSPFHNAGCITDISKQLSARSRSARKLQSVAQDKLRLNAPIDSQPHLFHPIPLTSRTSRVLSHTSSEADTAVAQIDIEPVATRSQILDEEIWKTWVLSSQDDLASESENRREDDVSISPGISNVGHRYFRKDSKHTIGGDPKCIKGSSEVKGIDYASDKETEHSNFERPFDIEGESNRREVIPKVSKGARRENVSEAEELMDYKTLFQHPQKIPSAPKSKSVRVDNPDEAWMKFILGDNDGDIEEDILRPNGQQKSISPALIQLPPPSSVVVHLSTETGSSSQYEVATSSHAGAASTLGNTAINVANLSTNGPQLSDQTTRGSNQSLSDELSDILSSVDQIPTHSAPSSTPSRPIRRLTFTKPPRFPSPLNRGSSPETAAATAGSPLHIGKGLLKRFAAVAQLKGGRGKARNEERLYERDIYGLETEDDIESIEDG